MLIVPLTCFKTDGGQGAGCNGQCQRFQVNIVCCYKGRNTEVAVVVSLFCVTYSRIAFHASFPHLTNTNVILHSLAAYEATEWARNKKNNTNSDGTSASANGPGEQSNYDLFRLAARNLESSYTHSMDIQEKYGIL